MNTPDATPAPSPRDHAPPRDHALARDHAVARIELIAVEGIGEVRAGDDLAGLIASAAQLRDGDVLVVSSKVVSKALGLVVAAPDRSAREAAIDGATVRLVARRRTPRGLARIVEAEAGPVMAAAGVDNSNVAAGTVLLLPKEPDAEARSLRARLHQLTGARIGVILSDTAGRAWRDGQTDFALGAAGVAITDDLRGVHDTAGQPMEVTVRAVADELAAAADLVKGKLGAVPVALVRGVAGLVADDDGPGAAGLLRRPGEDWFRLGHVEAVRAALGVDPADVDPPAVPPDGPAERLARVLAVAGAGGPVLAAAGPYSSRMLLTRTEGTRGVLTLGHATGRPGDWMELGALAQRVAAAAWSEDLPVRVLADPGPPPSLTVQVTSSP